MRLLRRNAWARPSWAAACLALVLGATTARGQVASLEPIAQVTGASSIDNQNPCVAATEDGRRVAVAWDGLVSGQRRILVRERVEGTWLAERIVDTDATAGNQSPSLALDGAGN